MSALIDNYRNLLIIQYADKPKAKKHIEAILSEVEKVYNLANSFENAFDLDLAVGKQLDILGKIVGISRIVVAIPKKYFGFSDYEYSYPMGDKFLTVVSYPMRDKFEIPYSSSLLNDYLYRFFIKAKVIKNYAKATMIDENKLSIQDVIDYLFQGKAYVVDNLDMTMSIYVDKSFDFDIIRYALKLSLIPLGQGVKISEVIAYDVQNTFGFKDNPNVKGFIDKFGVATGGYFAERIYF